MNTRARFPRNPFAHGEGRTVSLISVAHAFSHFYMLVLPPIFPLLSSELSVSYAALGTLLLVYAGATALLQIPMGLVVDRIGGRAVLAGGLALNGLGILLIGLVPEYWAMLLFMAIAGAGNAVFHPADYAILSARISGKRIGRAFSAHLFAGYIGWMCAPPFVLALTAMAGWQTALFILGFAGVAYALLLAVQKESLSDEQMRRDTQARVAHARKNGERTGLWLFVSPIILALFLFYFAISGAVGGIQNFSVVGLIELHGLSLTHANTLLTAYFVAAAAGTLLGGILADRVWRRELATAIAYTFATLIIFAIGFAGLPTPVIALLMVLAGITFSIAAPMRDVMVRNAAPMGQTGTTFAVVTSGCSVGFSLAPVFFGWIADIGQPAYIFWASAFATILAIITLAGVRAQRPDRTIRQ